jgi:hypothetical protein
MSLLELSNAIEEYKNVLATCGPMKKEFNEKLAEIAKLTAEAETLKNSWTSEFEEFKTAHASNLPQELLSSWESDLETASATAKATKPAAKQSNNSATGKRIDKWDKVEAAIKVLTGKNEITNPEFEKAVRLEMNLDKKLTPQFFMLSHKGNAPLLIIKNKVGGRTYSNIDVQKTLAALNAFKSTK